MSFFDDNLTIEQFGDLLDEYGRVWSPAVTRGSEQMPRSVPLPSPVEMRQMDTAELSAVLSNYGIEPGIEVSSKLTARYLERFDITPDDPRWGVEMERLLDQSSRRPVLAAARRSSERYETLLAAGGDMTVDTTYLAEGDNPCDECLPLAGSVMPLGERIAEGLMPSDRCLGKDLCQCGLAVHG
jgi:hypothetical protein